MEIKRAAFKILKQSLEGGKVVILYGPRRVGKTFLLTKLSKELKKSEKIAYFQGDRLIVRDVFSSYSPEKMISFFGKDTTLLILDEAQKIPEIGENLKLLVDTYPKLKIVASGSASFELAVKVGEPLTGRKKTVFLYPVWAKEVIETYSKQFFLETLEERLVFGSYPEIFLKKSREDKIEYLFELVDSYLLRDVLELENIRKSKKLLDLLALLAFQVGKEVSLSELANSLGIARATVERYLDLFEKAFILINIRGFSRNLRKEVTKNSRWYFWDLGIRNAVINNFNPLSLRDDVGALWENFLVIERIKKQSYQRIYSRNFFWRTWDQQEVDWVEQRDGKLFGYEFKFKPKKLKPPSAWKRAYPDAEFLVVSQENFLEFIT